MPAISNGRRRSEAGSPETARKLQQSGDALEKSALAKVGQTSPMIGKLLDLLA